MESIAQPRVRKRLGVLRLPLPKTRKGWAILLLVVPVVAMLTAGLAQIFDVELMGPIRSWGKGRRRRRPWNGAT
mgnify:CR=1 FL=1